MVFVRKNKLCGWAPKSKLETKLSGMPFAKFGSRWRRLRKNGDGLSMVGSKLSIDSMRLITRPIIFQKEKRPRFGDTMKGISGSPRNRPSARATAAGTIVFPYKIKINAVACYSSELF